MPRAKEQKRDQQVYKLAQYSATVTIDYDVKNPPPFFQPGAGVVIVGEHQCAPQQTYAVVSAPPNVPHQEVQRGGNFEVDPNDPAYLAFKARLPQREDVAPPDFSPRVITSEDLQNEFAQNIKRETGFDIGQGINAAALVATAGG